MILLSSEHLCKSLWIFWVFVGSYLELSRNFADTKRKEVVCITLGFLPNSASGNGIWALGSGISKKNGLGNGTVTSVGQRKKLSPRQDSNLWPPKHRAGTHRFESCWGHSFFLCSTLVTCWLFHFHLCFTEPKIYDLSFLSNTTLFWDGNLKIWNNRPIKCPSRSATSLSSRLKKLNRRPL